MSYAGLRETAYLPGSRWFVLSSPALGIEFIVHINGIRVDFSSGSIVLDAACMIPDLEQGAGVFISSGLQEEIVKEQGGDFIQVSLPVPVVY